MVEFMHLEFLLQVIPFLVLLICLQMHCSELLTALDAASDAPSPSQLEAHLFNALSPLGTLSRRCSKLANVLEAAERFATLGKLTHIPGMPAVASKFAELMQVLKRQHVDVLNCQTTPGFDTDVLDFDVHVNDLEIKVQDVLRESFDAAASTEHALSLLRQYGPLLAPDVAKGEVDSMYSAAFQRFGSDIEEVQAQYEKHKRDPPLPRGTPPAAGAIVWARGLLRRIERPMNL